MAEGGAPLAPLAPQGEHRRSARRIGGFLPWAGGVNRFNSMTAAVVAAYDSRPRRRAMSLPENRYYHDRYGKMELLGAHFHFLFISCLIQHLFVT